MSYSKNQQNDMLTDRFLSYTISRSGFNFKSIMVTSGFIFINILDDIISDLADREIVYDFFLRERDPSMLINFNASMCICYMMN